jgi:chromosome segregation ATPase
MLRLCRKCFRQTLQVLEQRIQKHEEDSIMLKTKLSVKEDELVGCQAQLESLKEQLHKAEDVRCFQNL